MMRPHVVIVRHPKERRSKCSLQPLRTLPGFTFYNARPSFTYDATGHLLLAMGAPVISPADAWLEDDEPVGDLPPADLTVDAAGRRIRPVLLLDSTWRLLPGMRNKIQGQVLERSLPSTLRTAYPRISKMTEDPEEGLASIEALYAALYLLGFNEPSLLDQYLWKEPFLQTFQDEVSPGPAPM